MPYQPYQNDRDTEDRKHRKGIAVEGFILVALVAVYFVISYEQ